MSALITNFDSGANGDGGGLDDLRLMRRKPDIVRQLYEPQKSTDRIMPTVYKSARNFLNLKQKMAEIFCERMFLCSHAITEPIINVTILIFLQQAVQYSN